MKNLTRLSCYGFVALLAITLFGAKLASSQAAPKLPSSIQECEKKSGSIYCMTWTLKGEVYETKRPDGSVETITPRIDSSKDGLKIHFVRNVAERSSDTLGVVYEGILRNGKIENGSVVWTYKGLENFGVWSGSYTE